jgi:hypothetical protein
MYKVMVREDSLIEYIQAGAYFLSSLLSLVISLRFFRKKRRFSGIIYLSLFLLLIFIGLEELRWGQGLFNIVNPDYFETHNVQKEISIHNLHTIQPYTPLLFILLGIYGTFTWILLRTEMRSFSHRIHFFAPDWFLSSYFFFVFIVYFFLQALRPFLITILKVDFLHIDQLFVWWDQEPAELLFSLGILLFVFINYFRQIERKIFNQPFKLYGYRTILL